MRTSSFRTAYVPILCIGAILLSANVLVAGSLLEEQLEQTGRAVEVFWQQMGSFACTERVAREKINKKLKAEYKAELTFDYLALARSLSNRLTIEELRLPQKGNSKKVDKIPLLETSGFPTLILVFHPQYQSNYHFQIEPGGTGDLNQTRVHFEQIAGRDSTCALLLRDRIYPLPLQGTAWIDDKSGIIGRIKASLIAPLNDINVHAFEIEVVYQPQKFSSDPEPVWLPAKASIDVRTALQHWRNTHFYLHYKRFSVESLESKLRSQESAHPD